MQNELKRPEEKDFMKKWDSDHKIFSKGKYYFRKAGEYLDTASYYRALSEWRKRHDKVFS